MYIYNVRSADLAGELLNGDHTLGHGESGSGKFDTAVMDETGEDNGNIPLAICILVFIFVVFMLILLCVGIIFCYKR